MTLRACQCFSSGMRVCECVPHPPTHKHTHTASSFWSHINMLWQFCVALWIFDLECVGEAGGLIWRDCGRQATGLTAKHIGKKKSLGLCVCVCVRGSLLLHVLNLLSSPSLSLLISLQGERVRMCVSEWWCWSCGGDAKRCMGKKDFSRSLLNVCVCVCVMVCLCWDALIRQKPWTSPPLWGWGVTSKVTACAAPVT